VLSQLCHCWACSSRRPGGELTQHTVGLAAADAPADSSSSSNLSTLIGGIWSKQADRAADESQRSCQQAQ
jgi:hypothetical protein